MALSSNVLNLLFGRPLATSEERAEHIGPIAGIPVFGLDALSSAAYGPEAALTLLIPLGLMGVQYIVPVSAAIVGLLTIVYFSYRQTIDAYPHGGGSYTVASENLGEGAGLLAAAALMIDYMLTAAVGISAGVGALISAVPSLQPHTLAALPGGAGDSDHREHARRARHRRGVHDSHLPVHGHAADRDRGGRVACVAQRRPSASGHAAACHCLPATAAVSLVAAAEGVLLRLHGHDRRGGGEQRRDGLPRRHAQERQDHADHHHRSAGRAAGRHRAAVPRLRHRAPPIPDGPGYESVLSMLTRAVMGHGWFYYVTIGSVLLVLALSANTAFADFPRLTRAIALDDYMPHVFLLRGRRLLYSWGIYVLVALTALLLILFGGVTDRLIPLYAIGAFMAFTLSQAGMVMHWKRQGNAPVRMFVNGLGAVATGITTLVVLVAKFAEGAWITALLVAVMILLMRAVKRHYVRVDREIDLRPAHRSRRGHRAHRGGAHRSLEPHHREGALVCAVACPTIFAACMCRPATSRTRSARSGKRTWPLRCARPASAFPSSRSCKSPYRYVLQPVVDYVLKVERESELPQGLRAGAGTGGASLVGEPAAQPPRGSAEGDPAAARQPAHRGDQYSLVSRAGLGLSHQHFL